MIVGVRAEFAISEGGLRFSKRRELHALAESEHARLMATERQVGTSVDIAWRSIEEAEARIIAARFQVEAASHALKGVMAEAAQGLRATLDVLDAERERADAEIALLRAEADFLSAQITLMSEIGGLEPGLFHMADVE